MRLHVRRTLAILVSAAVVAISTVAISTVAIQPAGASGVVFGLDVSGHQGNVNWARARAEGARFAYAKATEGTYFRNPYFTQQYEGSYYHRMMHGAYHFAIPNNSTGARQADYFIAHGGGWSRDGRTLPGALDIEYNPYGRECYGLSKRRMTNWILSFSNRYHAREHVWPVIYTNRSWWARCVGNESFSTTNPLWVANYSSSSGILPFDWGYPTFWQYNDRGRFPGDQDEFNGSMAQLRRIACAGRCR